MSHSRIGASASLLAICALLVGQGCGQAPVESSSAGLARTTGDGPADTTIVKHPPPPPPPPPPPSGGFVLNNADLANLAATAVSVAPTINCATTATIFDMQASVPVTDGAACTSDLDCGTGAFCSPGGSGASTCHTSGLLPRGNIYYVAGTTLDLTLTVSACGSVSDVLQGGVSLGGSGGFDDTGKQYTVLSTTPTTWQSQDATRLVVRINLLTFGDGTTSGFEVRVSAPLPQITTTASVTPGAKATDIFGSTASRTFTVAAVSAVNAAMHATLGETAMRSAFAVSMYREFGDADQVWQKNDDGTSDEVAHGLDWSTLGTTSINNQLHYTGTDLRIQEGRVAFSMKFKGQGLLCDTDVDVDGAFTLVPSLHNLQMQWLLAPKARVDAGTICTLLTVGLDAIITDIIVDAKGIEGQIGDAVKLQMQQSAGAGDTGVIPVCPTCTVQAVHVGSGRIDIYATPGVDSVRVAVSTTRYTDTTSDPNNMGLIIPPATFALVTSGGTYQSCIAADGTPAGTCAGLPLDAAGTFNWWGTDVPVPTPWPTGPNGQIGYIGARQEAWTRLIPLGLTRHAEQLPAPRLPAGALLARRGGGATNTPGPRLRVQAGCMIPPDATDATAAPTRIALGINDLPVVGTEPPTSGHLDATVLIPDAAQSQVLFASAGQCPAEPPAPFVLGSEVTAVETGTFTTAN